MTYHFQDPESYQKLVDENELMYGARENLGIPHRPDHRTFRLERQTADAINAKRRNRHVQKADTQAMTQILIAALVCTLAIYAFANWHNAQVVADAAVQGVGR